MLRAEICEIGIVKLNVHELEYLLYLFEIAILIHSYMLQCVVDLKSSSQNVFEIMVKRKQIQIYDINLNIYYAAFTKQVTLTKLSTDVHCIFLNSLCVHQCFKDVSHESLTAFLANYDFCHLISSLSLHDIISSDIVEKRHLCNKLQNSETSCKQAENG